MSEAHGTAVTGGTSPDEQPPSTPTSDPATSPDPVPDPATAPGPAPAGPVRSGPGVALAVVALLWAVAMLLSARITITGRAEAEMEVTSTAYALPGAISACLVAGAAVALLALGLLNRRGRTLGASARFGVTVATGLVTGLLAAVSMITINTEGWLYAVVGGTLAAAATLGGAIAGVRLTRVVASTCWAGLAVFAVGFGLNLFQYPLLRLFGAGDDQASQAGAVGWFAMTQSVTAGLAAGLVAYLTLRRSHNRGGGTGAPWPQYALAGAGPGILLVIAEGLARTAGARVLDLAGKVSEVELLAQDMLSGSRINNALIVTFVGAITAIIAIGRTMRPAPDDDLADHSADDPADGPAPA
jgi:iron complex transport system permease protein